MAKRHHVSMTPRAALLPAAAALALGLAHDATAATIATTRPCLNARSSAQFVATGFIPGATVRIKLRGVLTATAAAGPDGALIAPFTAPLADPNAPPEPVGLEATDGTNVAVGTVLRVVPGARLPSSGTTRIQMRILLTGYEPGQALYAHLRWGERWRRTLKLGTASGPCGTLDVKRKLLRKTAGSRGRKVYVQFDHTPQPATDTHQTAYARFSVDKGFARNPERYRLDTKGWG